MELDNEKYIINIKNNNNISKQLCEIFFSNHEGNMYSEFEYIRNMIIKMKSVFDFL